MFFVFLNFILDVGFVLITQVYTYSNLYNGFINISLIWGRIETTPLT